MASVALPSSVGETRAAGGAFGFVCAVLGLALVAAVLAGWAPVWFSIATVFLFAGPHNWFEARYMIGRMPARWGALTPFFATGIAGVLLLTAGFASLSLVGGLLSRESWLTATAVWNSALVLWIVALARIRSRQNPRREWPWLMPVGFGVVAAGCMWPLQWDLVLVYLHPLVALWFLDREIAARRPAWRLAYRISLAAVPLVVGLLWWRLAEAPNLAGRDALTMRIAHHAGSGILAGVSSHLLVSVHTFLESLHYGVWLIAIPMVSVKAAPWQLRGVPLARRSAQWRTALYAAAAVGGLVVLALWGGFLFNYPATRDFYFMIAMLHVLAEVPFLMRLL